MFYGADVVLRQMALPDIRAASGSELFSFFSSTVPYIHVHLANDTVALLDQDTPHFIPPALWPPYSPDLRHSTETALLRVWSDILEAADEQRAVLQVFKY